MPRLTQQNVFYNFLIWTIVAFFTATQLYLKDLQAGGSQSWVALLKVQLWVWWIWGVITPLVFWLGNRFRIDKSSFFLGVLIHLPIAVIIVCCYLFLYAVIWILNAQGTLNWDAIISIFAVLFTGLFHWHFFIYMGIIGIVHAHSFYTESRDRALKSIQLEKELLQSRLNFLKMQLQPHFLFNTLNGIVSAIHQKNSTVAANMTTELSELLRISLAGSDRQIVSLKQELEHLKTYLNIEKFRFKKLQVNFNIPDILLDREVPNFFLQPIVENAIKHGISKQSAASLIELSASKKNSFICFKVYNEGPAPEDQTGGIGLTNVKRRLEALFDSDWQFDIEPYLKGTLVTIQIPDS